VPLHRAVLVRLPACCMDTTHLLGLTCQPAGRLQIETDDLSQRCTQLHDQNVHLSSMLAQRDNELQGELVQEGKGGDVGGEQLWCALPFEVGVLLLGCLLVCSPDVCGIALLPASCASRAGADD